MTLKLTQHFTRFLTADSGAVTVDWVVLTAAITGLGLASAAAVRTGTSALATDVSSSLSNAEVASLECLGSNTGPSGFECYTGPTISASLYGYGYGTGGSCSMTSQGVMTCGPSTVTTTEVFEMSDGSQYSQTTVRVGSQDPVITWRDENGVEVDAPPPLA